MSTHPIRPISPAYSTDEEDFVTRPLAASETFKKGACIVETSGAETVEEAGTDPALIVGFATAGAADYAWKYDTFGHVTGTPVPVAKCKETIFRGSLSDAASASAVTIADVSAEVGKQYGLVLDATTGYWVVDHAETSNKRVQIVKIDDAALDGDGNIPVLFRVLAANVAAV